MIINKRGIASSIILSIVTCGIYGIYWWYKILSDIYTINEKENRAGMDIVLSLVTCGIYAFILYYNLGNALDDARKKYGLPEKNDSLLYLLLAIFGLAIVADCIIQNELNETFADLVNGVHTDTPQY